jgi:hypothetical protein
VFVSQAKELTHFTPPRGKIWDKTVVKDRAAATPVVHAARHCHRAAGKVLEAQNQRTLLRKPAATLVRPTVVAQILLSRKQSRFRTLRATASAPPAESAQRSSMSSTRQRVPQTVVYR